MAELLLDSNIRIWVFLPIIMITFLVGILRHYFSLIIASQKKVELLQVQDRYRNRIQLKFRIKRAHLICFFAVKRWFVPDCCEKMGNFCPDKLSWWEDIFSTVKIWATSKLRNGLPPPPIPWQIQMQWLICLREMLLMSYLWLSSEDGSTGPFQDLLQVPIGPFLPLKVWYINLFDCALQQRCHSRWLWGSNQCCREELSW